ncbi:hypothetical protein MNR01_14760 [Lysobacter sp. S4-A87]|uniref:hypothetical protein n=1 Tax=Lysobacter sp. S4-A87 TaxID=2925843 RepID=UPI001F533CB6|nr:hypothetical protein [Lysobacter sp. S4-A87]UNK48981.1 hypothetical protein MNR01_14760 [Lysobacter sp. S4-A87]
MLPVTFVLIGIALWYRANDAFSAGFHRKGSLLALVSVMGCGLLAGLSKANGFLLPALLLVLQVTVLDRPANQRNSQLPAPARLGLLWLPTAAIVLWLTWIGIWHWGDTFGRPWTVGQRLLTEPRALCDYVWLLLRPVVHSRGLFADDFAVSTSLWSPSSSLPALVAVLACAATAWRYRKRTPAVAAGILFFLCGHLVESTSYPLELYFEHRNYLPALFLGWPLGIWLTAPGKWLAGRSATAIVLLGTIALITHSRASLWGDPQRLGMSWAEHFPASARAQAYAAALELDNGHPEKAVARLRPRLDTTEVQYALNLIDAECAVGSVRPATLTAAESTIERTGVGKDLVHHWLRDKLEAPAPACDGLDGAYERLVAAARRHPAPEPMESNRLSQLSGLLALHRGHCRNSLDSFNDGLRFERHAAQVFGQAGMLATHCGAATALPHIVRYRMRPLRDDTAGKPGMPRIHQWVLLRQHYWEDELNRLESLLRSEVADSREAAPMGHVPQQ